MKAIIFKNNLLASVSIALLTFTSCEDNVIRGGGDVVSETRTVGAFNVVEVSGDMEVYVTQGAAQDIRLEGQANVLDVITTKVNGNELEIKYKPFVNVKRHETVRIYITNPTLTSLEVSGSSRGTGRSDWAVDDLRLQVSGSGSIALTVKEADHVDSRISGSGNVSVSGDAETFNSEISGSGNVQAFGLESQSAYAKISGSGNCELTVFQTLDAQVSGSGNVRYKGNPTVNVTISGSGKVTRAN